MSQDVYYRPPSEEDSFIVRVMEGCSHNKCTFCNTFRDVPCRVLSFEEVAGAMQKDADTLGPRFIGLVQSIYLEGGDPLVMPGGRLLAIMEQAGKVFPEVKRFACYATAKQLIRKTQAELENLAAAGLKTVFVGLESGSDRILKDVNKGCTRADLLLAGKMLAKAGIEMDVSMMLGIGGREGSQEHANATADALNAIAPKCVRIMTFIPKIGTELGEDYLAGKFNLPGPHEIMWELRLLVSRINVPIHLVSDHWTNFVGFRVWLPEGREALMTHIDRHLEMPETAFRKVGIDAVKS